MSRIIDGDEKNLVGGNVRKYRKQHKLSQQALSDRLEILGVYICRGSISRIEDKSRTVTDIELFGLSQILGVDISTLFEGKNEGNEKKQKRSESLQDGKRDISLVK